MTKVKTPESVAMFLRGRRIAVAGVSRRPNQAANAVFRKLRGSGYEVFPINPKASEVEGATCYSDVGAVPGQLDGVVIATSPDISIQIVRRNELPHLDGIEHGPTAGLRCGARRDAGEREHGERKRSQTSRSHDGPPFTDGFLDDRLHARCFRAFLDANETMSHDQSPEWRANPNPFTHATASRQRHSRSPRSPQLAPSPCGRSAPDTEPCGWSAQQRCQALHAQTRSARASR